MSYRLIEGSLQDQFNKSRSKVQLYAGGYGNGKTSCAVVLKALVLARDYPGSRGLIARATCPKLNETVRVEFEKWCPPGWIARFPKTQENTCYLTNGTVISFRYVSQTGVMKGQETSNLLSATYDWIVFDQIDDPEFTSKDFKDLFGRLRGDTPYTGNDTTMPSDGPRWMILTCNPTASWVYREIVRPYERYNDSGIIDEHLLCRRDKLGNPILDADGKPQLLLTIVSGSTYENKANLPDDYIEGLESLYSGVMRDRFLLGKWGAYEGLIYPMFDPQVHCIPRGWIIDYISNLRRNGYNVGVLGAYDYGMRVPSCFGVAFTDHLGNTFLIDGYYEAEMPVDAQAAEMKRLDKLYGPINTIYADPAIFRRSAGTTGQVVGVSVAGLFKAAPHRISMVRGNNDITNGITKVRSHLELSRMHQHPVTREYESPHFYIAEELEWWCNEASNYMWKKSTSDGGDVPVDKDDHAMDMTKYLLSRAPRLAVAPPRDPQLPPSFMQWREQDLPRQQQRSWRYM